MSNAQAPAPGPLESTSNSPIPDRICNGCANWVYSPLLLCGTCQAVQLLQYQNSDMGRPGGGPADTSSLQGIFTSGSLDHDVKSLHWPQEVVPMPWVTATAAHGSHAPQNMSTASEQAQQQVRQQSEYAAAPSIQRKPNASTRRPPRRVPVPGTAISSASAAAYQARAPAATNVQISKPHAPTDRELYAAAALLELRSRPVPAAGTGIPSQAGLPR